MFTALLVSFGVVFVAELGDKSQLMAMTYAIRYRWWVVLSAILAATTLVHLVSVAVGHFLGLSIPSDLISVVGGIAMLVFAVWTIRGDDLDDGESDKANRVGASVFFAVMSSFFLAELGDKTMLATITLSTDHNWVGVWFGSTIGMVAADALAIVVGAILGRKLPERVIALGAAALFLVFGVWLLTEGILTAGSPLVAGIALATAAVVLIGGAFYIRSVHRRRALDQQRKDAEPASIGASPSDRSV